jgi:hypothetical protein
LVSPQTKKKSEQTTTPKQNKSLTPTFPFFADKDLLKELSLKVKEDIKQSNEKGLVQAALFHWLVREHDKAREYAKMVSFTLHSSILFLFPYNTSIKQAIEKAPNYTPAQVALGWIDLTCGRDALVKKSIQYFENALQANNKKDVEVRVSCFFFGVFKFQFVLIFFFSLLFFSSGFVGQSKVLSTPKKL